MCFLRRAPSIAFGRTTFATSSCTARSMISSATRGSCCAWPCVPNSNRGAPTRIRSALPTSSSSCLLTDWFSRVRQLNVSAASFACSVAALGHALQISSGTFHPEALWWLSLAFGLCLLGTLTHRLTRTWSDGGVRTTTTLLAAGVLWNVKQLLTARPGVYIEDTTTLLPFYAGVA